jgi:hypothetical protein
LLQTLAEVWERFATRFDALWHAHDPATPAAFRQSFLLALLHDSIGFAACKMIRRVLGVAHVIDLEQIADTAQRAPRHGCWRSPSASSWNAPRSPPAQGYWRRFAPAQCRPSAPVRIRELREYTIR